MRKHTMLSRIAAAACMAVFGCTMLTGCDIAESVLGPSYADQSETETEAPSEESAVPGTEPTTEPETEETTVHVSPTESVTSSLGAQLETDVYLNKDSSNDDDKICKVALDNFIQQGDKVESFVFVFYADGNMGTYQGACGISVTDDSPVGSDGWYASPNFEASTQGGFAEIRWNVPSDIRDCIDASGEVQIGYWWGDVSTVHLKEIICNYSRTVELPVDVTTEIPIGQDLYYDNDDAKYARVPVGRLFDEDGIPQAVTYHLTSPGRIGKFVGGFTADGGGEPYTSSNIAILSDATDLNLTWILPESVRHTGVSDLGIGFWWGEQGSITLDSITVKYTTGSAPAAAPAPAESSESTSKEDTPVSNSKQAAQIAADIRVGWNLGNTLDCYDDKAATKPENLETYWGNVKTTKATIDTVKAKGFNAVRIPVTWGNHMDSDGTIDSAWMARVQEIVDYAIDNDMYVILNTHHEDALWMHPVYSEESTVTERFVRAWEQIAARFKDYDNKLLFEGLNEPRIHGTSSEWMGGTSEERSVINHMEEQFISTVRASGGNNAKRTLIITTHAASITDAAISGLTLPDDDNIIVSIHNYAPWKLTTLEYPDDRSFD
ncbi:MAG: cellulase family glycosylhydrolase, partial [Oscillospiraceae bacterium]|nr:cellulase family glycosylhydrolase [Oscillospiraceae bacterium]